VTDSDDEQTFQSRGLERQGGNAVVGFVRVALGVPHKWELAPAPTMIGYTEEHRGTPNHRGLLRLWRWAWALLNGDDVEKERSEHYLIEWFELQFTTEGQQYREMLNTSHYQIWAEIVSGALVLAKAYNRECVEELAIRWWNRELWLYERLSLHGHVFAPGTRSASSNSELRDVIYALLKGTEIPRRLKNGRPLPDFWWDDVFNCGAQWMRYLIYGGTGVADRLQSTERPVLGDTLYIHRRGFDYIATFTRITKATGPILFWAGVLDGEPVSAPVHTHDVNNLVSPYKPPSREWTDVEVVPGVQ
jgi:hypothetical protein